MEKAAQDISEDIVRQGHEVTVLCCQPRGHEVIETLNGVKVIKCGTLGMVRGMPFSLNFIYKFIIMSKDFDLVALHDPFPLADFAVWLGRLKGRVVIHYHSDIVRQKFLRKLTDPFQKYALGIAQNIIVSNENLKNNSQVLSKFKNKIEVIPFGIDSKKIRGMLDKQAIDLHQKKYGKFILFVGRLSYYKGIEYLIKAMKQIEANLIIVGKGEEKEGLTKLINDLILKNKIVFLENLSESELYSVMAGAEMLVLPSIYPSEAFGLVLIEALAVGTPLITTELGTGTSWVNKNAVTGYVVKPRDSKSLAQAISKILRDDKLRIKLSVNALERSKRFDKNKVMKLVLKVYQKRG